MKTSIKLGGFALGALALLAASYGVGSAVGPIGRAAPAAHQGAEMTDETGHGGHDTAAQLPKGLMVSEAGYTLRPADQILPAGISTVAFQIIGPDGRPVTAYTPTHDKDLHLIAVRRDTTGFQHLHPTLDASGTWTAPVKLTPGVWRLFADFRPAAADEAITLGTDLSVAGGYDPRPLPATTRTAQVDGYTVTLAGDLAVGASSELTLTVSKGGKPVTDLQPYLAAYGHLVALRAGDLAYLHVHPEGEPGDGITEPGPDIVFDTTAPTAGTYRLFLDFQHDGAVRTAEFTLAVPQRETFAGEKALDEHGR